MNNHVLDSECQRFIKKYKEELSVLAFAGSPFPTITIQELLQQIESRRKIKKKLPTWYHQTGIYYPPKLNLEQTSSEITANYKATLVSGVNLADLTGGFGVDSYHFSKTFKSVDHFETNIDLSAIASKNFKVLDAKNVSCFPLDGVSGITDKHYDVIYADPSRRHDQKGKVFYLTDCEPNIPEHASYLLTRCDTLLVKTSPMLDITVGLSELTGVAEIHIVAIENEVKELLWVLRNTSSEAPSIKTINFTKHGQEVFKFQRNEHVSVAYSLPKQFLYEPNAAIMKSGGFNILSAAFGLDKLHKNSHLYTADILVDFPGRCFVIDRVVFYNKKDIKKALAFTKANITTRNFPESVTSIRTKWKIKDGGDHYLFFTTLMDEQKVMLVCRKVNSLRNNFVDPDCAP